MDRWHDGERAHRAYDPIFWAHHTMVDRVWSLWQVKHSSPGPPPQAWTTQLRADLVFDGVGSGGDSFVGRIFLAADADETTPTTIDTGYAGSMYVFGHGRCFGDPGHCEVPSGPIHPFDYRRPHMLTPQVHVVRITEALRALNAPEFAVTVFPTTATGQPAGDVLSLTGVSLVTYD